MKPEETGLASMMQVPDDDRMERQLRHLNLDAAEFTFSGSLLEKNSHLTPSWSQATTSNLDGWDFAPSSTAAAFRSSSDQAEERYQYSPPNQQWSDGSHHSGGGSGIWGDDHSRGSQTSGTIPSYNPTLTDYLSRPDDAPLKQLSNPISDDLRAPVFDNFLKETTQLEDNSSSYFDSNAFSSTEYFGSISSVGSIPGLVPSSSSITSAGSGWKSQPRHQLPKKQSSLAAAIAAASHSNSMGPPPGFKSENFVDDDEPSERSVGSRGDKYDGSNRRRGKNNKGARSNIINNRRQNTFRKGDSDTQNVLPSDSDAGPRLSSQAVQQLLRPEGKQGSLKVPGRPSTISEDYSESNYSLTGHYFDQNIQKQSILPHPVLEDVSSFFGGRNQYYGLEQAAEGEDDVDFIFGARSEDEEDTDSFDDGYLDEHGDDSSPRAKKREWLLRMNKKLTETPVGGLDPAVISLTACMNSWAKTKSANGASMVEMWLKRAEEEKAAGNTSVVPTTKMYTMAGKDMSRSSFALLSNFYLTRGCSFWQLTLGPKVDKELPPPKTPRLFSSVCLKHIKIQEHLNRCAQLMPSSTQLSMHGLVLRNRPPLIAQSRF